MTRSEALKFRNDDELQERALSSLDVMLGFYGMERDGKSAIRRGSNFDDAAQNWLSPGNHNYLRLARILGFLSMIGLEDMAKGLLLCLEDIAAHEGVHDVSARTLGFWRRAIEPKRRLGA